MIRQSYAGNAGTADWLIGAAKNNPEGLLLVAAGFALLIRRANRGQQTDFRSRQNYMDGSAQGRRGATGDTLREYVSDVGEKLTASASSVASSASDYADQARRSISETSGWMAEQAQSTVQDTMTRMVREQPLAFALLGVVTGAAAAAVLPASDFEKQTLGPVGERLADTAEMAGERLKDSTAKAGEHLKTAATDSLKEVATDVAGAVSSALSGEQKNASGQPSSAQPGGGSSGNLRGPGGSGSSAGSASSVGSPSSTAVGSGRSEGTAPGSGGSHQSGAQPVGSDRPMAKRGS